MVRLSSFVAGNEKEALLIMFGTMWQKKFYTLDGQQGRPSLAECIDFALQKKPNSRAQEDLVDFLEKYLADMSKRCEKGSSTKGS